MNTMKVECDRCPNHVTQVTASALRTELIAKGWTRKETDDEIRQALTEYGGVFYLRCTAWPPAWHGAAPGEYRPGVAAATGATS